MSKRQQQRSRRVRLASIATAAVALGSLGSGAAAQDPVALDYWYQSSGPEGLADPRGCGCRLHGRQPGRDRHRHPLLLR